MAGSLRDVSDRSQGEIVVHGDHRVPTDVTRAPDDVFDDLCGDSVATGYQSKREKSEMLFEDFVL